MAKEQTPAGGDLYARLGIDRSATDEQIQDAYYRLAKASHLDKRKSGEVDEAAFNRIVRAAAILRDPARRELYDRGAIDEDGLLAHSSGRWPRWSYREQVLACLTAAMTVLVSLVALYSLDRSRPDLSPAGAHAGRTEKSPEIASTASPGTPLRHPEEQAGEPASAPVSDGSPAEILKALQRQRAVYSPPPATDNRAKTVSALAAPAADARDQAVQKNSIILKKPAAPKQRSKIALSSNVLLISPHPQGGQKIRSECSLTSAAKDILAGIISR